MAVGTIIIANILKGVILLANFYLLFMFILAIMSILAVFQIIDIFNGSLANVYFFIRRIVYPPVDLLAQIVPRIGGFDLPFLAFLILLWIIIDVCKAVLASLYASSFTF